MQPIQSTCILEISEGLYIRRFQTTHNMKYLVHSCSLGLLRWVADRRSDDLETRTASIFQGWLNLIHVDAETAGKKEICGSSESILAPSQSYDWSNFLPLHHNPQIPSFKTFQHPRKTDWVTSKDKAAGPSETSEHYDRAQKPTIRPSTDQQPSWKPESVYKILSFRE
jgi:hypothetical protein